MIRFELYLIAARKYEKLFLFLLLCAMGNTADLSNFNNGQNVMARRNELLRNCTICGCSELPFVDTYEKCMNDGETHVNASHCTSTHY